MSGNSKHVVHIWEGVEVANRHIFHSLMTERRAFYW